MYVVINGVICMTLIVFFFFFFFFLGPRQRRSLQKLEMMIVSRSLVVWDCLVSCCARVDSVGGFGYCKPIFLTTDEIPSS